MNRLIKKANKMEVIYAQEKLPVELKNIKKSTLPDVISSIKRKDCVSHTIDITTNRTTANAIRNLLFKYLI